MHSFHSELTYFNSIKKDMLKHNYGQFALIKGKKLMGTFTTSQQAYESGIKQFGNEIFLIKQILKEDPIQKIPALTHSFIHARIY